MSELKVMPKVNMGGTGEIGQQLGHSEEIIKSSAEFGSKAEL
jgi:hypothetical protein